MCGPVPLLVTSLVISAVGGYMQYDSSKKAQKYNEAVAENNAKAADAQALDRQRLGQIEAQDRRLRTRLMLAEQQAGFGAQNVETSGTALDILGDTALFGELDEGRIRAQAAREAWGFEQQGWNARAQKKLIGFEGKAQRTGILLSTASSMASAGYSYYGSLGKVGGAGSAVGGSAATGAMGGAGGSGSVLRGVVGPR